MTHEKYLELLRDYDLLLNYSRVVCDSFEGRELPDAGIEYSTVVFRKLVLHAISLRALSPTLSPGPDGELWDLSSACCVARALIETFDALSYIALNDITPQERQLRVLLWEVNGSHRQIEILKTISSSPAVIAREEELALVKRGELEAHPLFNTLHKDVKAKVKKGDAPHWKFLKRDLRKESNVDDALYNSNMILLSQHVHTLPMALRTLRHFDTRNPEALRLCSLPVRSSIGFLARATVGMVETFDIDFPSPDQECERVIEVWQHMPVIGFSATE